eukprot:365647-Chlamydomonas_euryale.AAC.10
MSARSRCPPGAGRVACGGAPSARLCLSAGGWPAQPQPASQTGSSSRREGDEEEVLRKRDGGSGARSAFATWATTPHVVRLERERMNMLERTYLSDSPPLHTRRHCREGEAGWSIVARAVHVIAA